MAKVVRISPGVYEVDGKRINADTSEAALAKVTKAAPKVAAPAPIKAPIAQPVQQNMPAQQQPAAPSGQVSNVPQASAPAAPAAPAQGFAPAGNEADLKAQRERTLREIESRGGKDKAPNYAARLQQIDSALRTARGGNPTQPTVPSGEPPPPSAGGNGNINPNLPLNEIPKTIDDVRQGLQAEETVQDTNAGKNINLNNPDVVNPFGSSTTRIGPDGKPIVEQKLEQGQQGIVNKDTAISDRGRQLAQGLLDDPGFSKSFQPQTDKRVGSGDLIADRKRQEQELANYLGRDVDTNYAKDKEMLDQRLYSQGISTDPQNERYKAELKQLNDQRARDRQGVNAQALQFGGQEMDRTFGQNEQTIANQYSQGMQSHQQQFNDVSNLSNLGPGARIPQFDPYQGYNYALPSPTNISSQLDQAKIQRKQLQIQQQALNKPTGGGGGGTGAGSGTGASSPFIEG